MNGSQVDILAPRVKRTPEGWTYKKAGVDIEGIRAGHNIIAGMLRETERRRRLGRVIHGPGHYAGLIDVGGERVLAIHTDGVGTKVLISQMMNRFDTIGIDCIAMNVNDLICVGAEPLAFVDYIALKKADQGLIKEIMKGLVRGAKEASVAIVGGETAVMPDVIEGVGEKAFDLAGTVVGLVAKDRIITGARLKAGDVVLGVESSGIHSNGLSLARKVLLQHHKVDEELRELGKSLGEELLTPTRIYVKPVLKILQEGVGVSGLAHITGGAFAKLRRIGSIASVGFNLDHMPKPPAIFKLIQREGRISGKEMYRTFNMGIGFCISTDERYVEEVKRIFKEHRMVVHEIGRVVSDKGVIIEGKQIA